MMQESSLALLLVCFVSASKGFSTPRTSFRPPPLSATATAVEPEELAAATERTATKIISDNADFIKPLPDNRQYRAVELPNGLTCLLVSAPESDVEAASVHVQAGHMDDPATRPGLAHFHEHMLFLGTEKYPSEDEYEAFLNQNGGSSNAYTDMEDTNYYFSVTPGNKKGDTATMEMRNSTTSEALSGGLDRLAQFFIKPNFDASMVDRELRAIDSEYRNSFTSDAWRNYQLLKSTANPSHPFSKFGCGNYKTLTQGGGIVNATHAENIASLPVEDLEHFWKTYYQTYNLRLAVVGQASLDDLQQTVEQTFGHLPPSTGTPRHSSKRSDAALFQREHAQYENAPPAFGTDQLGKIRTVVPLMDSRDVKLYFSTPPLNDPVLKESRPYRVISHLLGHESPGSLHSLLNDEGLITGLSSGIGIDTSDFSLFSISVSLTPKGMAQQEYVLSLIFQWIALIRKEANNEEHNILKSYHDELHQISDMNFQFRENGDPTDFCSRAADLMFDYEPSKLLYGSGMTGDFDSAVATAFLERLTPEHAMVTVIRPEEETEKDDDEWQKEQWYGAKYKVTDMTEEQKAEWTNPPKVDERLRLPALNEYIPTDFSLKCDQDDDSVTTTTMATDDSSNVDDGTTPPSVIVDRPGLQMWHKMDSKWRVPKTFIRISLQSPNVYRSPRTMTLNRIYERILNDDLNSLIYDATLAGCHYRVSCVPTGLRISLRGYSEKLPSLLDTLTTRMLSLLQELKEGPEKHAGLALKFKKAHDNLLRETKNYRLDTPYEICNYNARLLLEESVWYVDNYVHELESPQKLTMQECGQVAEECLQGRLNAEALCIGNINEQEALQVSDVVDEHFLKTSRPLLDVEIPKFRSMKLPTVQEARQIYGTNATSSSIPVVFQEVAFSESEENNAIELLFQAGCDFTLGYSGVAVLDLISHLAYNSAYNQLRTKEQLGYIVSAFCRKVAGGGWSLAVIIQSSVALPSVLEERAEAWLAQFRTELENMSLEELEKEASAVVAQLLERDTKLSSEVGTMWGEIITAEGHVGAKPAFDRVDKVAQQLSQPSTRDLKQSMLDMFDLYFAQDSPERRAMSVRVYNSKTRAEFDANEGQPGVLSSYSDIAQKFKPYLSTYPMAPYWRSTSE